MVRSTNEIIIPVLLKQVNELNLYCFNDVLRAKEISTLAFAELKKLKNKYRKKILMKKGLDLKTYAIQEAEEEIVLSIINLLMEKMINCNFTKLKKYQD